MPTIQPPSPPFVAARWHGGAQTPRTIVIHGTVSPCEKGGARNIARFFATHGEPTSAHYTVDPSEVIQSVGDHTVAYHCGHNQDSIGVELCDPQVGKDSRWQDGNHEAMLKEAAALVAQLCLAYGIPVKRIDVGDLLAGKHGICGHADMSNAFHQSTHTDPGAAFPWKHFMSLVRAAVADLTAPPKPTTPAAPKPAPKPVKKHVAKPTGAKILKAGAVDNTPSDHLAPWARLQYDECQFVIATANIRATPPMRAANVQKCVDTVLAIPYVSLVGFNEMQGRDLSALLATHPTWRAVQGKPGDQARAPIAYDSRFWRPDGDPEFVQLSSRGVTTTLGRIFVPSGNRWATVQRFRNRGYGVPVTVVSYHAIAHMNVGAHFGYTGQGPKALLALRGKIANPAVDVFSQGMRNLEALVTRLRADGAVVVVGDLNFNAFADLKAQAAGNAEPLGPAETFTRCGVQTIYATGALTTGTDKARGIDYIGIAPKETP